MLQSTFCPLLIISRELRDFRPILDMGKHLSLVVTLKMNHRLVINISFLFTTERLYFVNNHAPVVQRLDNAIHQINHYPLDKCL